MPGAPSSQWVLVQRATENVFNVIVAPSGPYTDMDISVRFKPMAGRPLVLSSYAGCLAPETPRRALRYTRRGKGKTMPYTMQPLACDPTKLEGLSEQLIVSHYGNNYGGAVRRLNAITAQLASLDVATAPVFVLNGLKREELIATNSM